jgi:hypothetical protein
MLESAWSYTLLFFSYVPIWLFLSIPLLALLAYCCITHVPKDYLAAIKQRDGSLLALTGDDFYWTPFQTLQVFSWMSPFGKKRRTVRYKYVNIFHSVKREFLNQSERHTFEILLSIYVEFNKTVLYQKEPLASLNKAIIETSDEFFRKSKKAVRLTYDEKSCRKSPYGKVLTERLDEEGFAKLRLLQVTVREVQL